MSVMTEPAVYIRIAALTASFRAPSFVAYQPSLSVPPPATIFGLLSAASGRWITPEEVPWLAYRFTYAARAFDLETIYMVQRDTADAVPRFADRNIVRREFLLSPVLDLWLPSEWRAPFERPRYQLVLGRSQDIAMVETIQQTVMEPVEEGAVAGVVLPIELVVANGVTAILHNLPIAFTADPERRPYRVALFGVLDGRRSSLGLRNTRLTDRQGWLIRDQRLGIVVPRFTQEWMLRGD